MHMILACMVRRTGAYQAFGHKMGSQKIGEVVLIIAQFADAVYTFTLRCNGLKENALEGKHNSVSCRFYAPHTISSYKMA